MLNGSEEFDDDEEIHDEGEAVDGFHFTIDDPTDPHALTDFPQLIDVFSRTPTLTGLSIYINGELTPAISAVMCPVLQQLPFSHFKLEINTFDPQNIDDLLQVFANKPLQSLSIDAPLTRTSITTLQNILAKQTVLESFTLSSAPELQYYFSQFLALVQQHLQKLQKLAINHCQLTARQATALVLLTANTVVQALDLSWNYINHTDKNDDFLNFCDAVMTSQLRSLVLSNTSFSDSEAQILASRLLKIPDFHFSFNLTPALKAQGIDYFIQALRANKKFTLTIEDPLNYFMKMPGKAIELKQAQEDQKHKTLFERAADVIVQYPDRFDLDRLPLDCLLRLPPTTYQQRVKLEMYEAQSKLIDTLLDTFHKLKISDTSLPKPDQNCFKQAIIQCWKSKSTPPKM